jgi:hypothetical protein
MEFKDHEITGFVNFPHHAAKSIKPVDTGQTMVYLVAFSENVEQMVMELPLIGSFAGDDITPKNNYQFIDNQDIIDNLKNNQITSKDYYFSEDLPFKVISAILIGWSEYTYEYVDRIEPWSCTFRELTNEGKKLYYSMKKLHNDSEIRILTFNNIK